MIEWEAFISNHINNTGNTKDKEGQYKRLVSMCRASVGIIDELFNPIDAANRFINLALQNIEEDSQSREFLLESKQGIRRTSSLLKRLDNTARRIERELRDISSQGQGQEGYE